MKRSFRLIVLNVLHEALPLVNPYIKHVLRGCPPTKASKYMYTRSATTFSLLFREISLSNREGDDAKKDTTTLPLHLLYHRYFCDDFHFEHVENT